MKHIIVVQHVIRCAQLSCLDGRLCTLHLVLVVSDLVLDGRVLVDVRQRWLLIALRIGQGECVLGGVI